MHGPESFSLIYRSHTDLAEAYILFLFYYSPPKLSVNLPSLSEGPKVLKKLGPRHGPHTAGSPRYSLSPIPV